MLAVTGLAVDRAEAANPKISVAVGQSVTQGVSSPIKTISIADTEIADVVVAGPLEILVNGKEVGFTTLVVWDQNNQSTIFNVVVRGPFSDQQIELRVKVAEVNRDRALEVGFDWFLQDGDWTAGVFAGKPSPPQVPLALWGQGQSISEGGATVTQSVSSELTDVAFRYMTGSTDLQTMIKAAQEDGVLRILAEPNVVASSGKPASFLSGGEFPIPVASSGAQGGSSISIEFKEFGVGVDFLPTIVDSGVINLQVAPSVSNLDYSSGIQLSGFTVPGLRTRRASTTVELEDGQVLVIGGLLLETEEEVRRRIPILGHIPLLGYLFSNTRTQRTQSELLLVVSPHIIRALPKGTQVSLPGDEDES